MCNNSRGMVDRASRTHDVWYLRGKSQQSGTFGEVIALRFTSKPR